MLLEQGWTQKLPAGLVFDVFGFVIRDENSFGFVVHDGSSYGFVFHDGNSSICTMMHKRLGEQLCTC